MYSDRLVADRLEQARCELGYKLEMHSPSDIDLFEADLRRKGRYEFDAQGRPISLSNLSPDEIRFIENEQALVRCDHAYALTRYAWIKPSEGGVIKRFTFRLSQRILFELIAQMEDEGIAIEIIILKARQLGMTTLVQLLLMLRVVFGYAVNAVAASAAQAESGLMANKLFMAYDMLPLWLAPRATARAEEGDQRKLVFAQQNTLLSIQHGKKMSGGIAQGWTPSLYHLTEVALFPNPNIQIDEGLWKAVHPHPSVLGVLESTGAGDQGWWADTWRYSKANWPERACRMAPLFLPWFIGVELYPNPTWIKGHPIPPGWYERRLPDTREHVAKSSAYVSSTPILRRHLGHSWEMPLAQQYWWELGHEEAKSKGEEAIWYQGYCGDDIEALQRSAEGVFGHDLIVEIGERRERSCTVYGLSGQSVEECHEPDPDEIDYSRDRLSVPFSSPAGETFRWEFIPLYHDDAHVARLRSTNTNAFKDYASGKLFVYSEPRAGVDYSIGVDTANGIGGDSTVICVTEIGRDDLPDTQVAEYRSPFMSHVEAFAPTLAIAAYYSRFMGGPDNPYFQPLVGVEQIRSVGDTCQLQMRKMGYSRFFRFGRLDGKRVAAKDANRFGWFTNGWSRPILIDGFVKSVEFGWYKLNSPWTIFECEKFQQVLTVAGKVKQEHESGEHDDGIFAAAISLAIARIRGRMADRTKKKYMGPTSALARPNLDFRPGGFRVNPDAKPDDLRSVLR